MFAYTYTTQHCLNVTSHYTLHYQGMMKDVVVIFWWIDWLVLSNILYVCFFHQSSMTVQPEVVTAGTSGIVAKQRRVLAIAMMALETDKCQAYVGFVSGYAEDDFQHMFQVALRKQFQITASIFHCELCCTCQTACEAE